MISYDNKNWISQLFAVKGTVFANIYGRVLFFIAWTAGVCFIYHQGYLTENAKIDMVVFNVVGLALGLLLVFRTNTSYDRYWEGRKLLGSTTNSTRNISIMLNKMLLKDDIAGRKYYYQMLSSFFAATKEHLREGVKEEHIPLLPEKIKADIMKRGHIPIAILEDILLKTKDLNQDKSCSEADLLTLNSELLNLSNNLGGMERIKNTPVPFAYASHLQLFVMLYFTALPFGLYDKFHWMSIPVIGIVSFILLGINEIGVEIEDPFGDDPNDLPTDKMCENAEKLVKEVLL